MLIKVQRQVDILQHPRIIFTLIPKTDVVKVQPRGLCLRYRLAALRQQIIGNVLVLNQFVQPVYTGRSRCIINEDIRQPTDVQRDVIQHPDTGEQCHQVIVATPGFIGPDKCDDRE